MASVKVRLCQLLNVDETKIFIVLAPLILPGNPLRKDFWRYRSDSSDTGRLEARRANSWRSMPGTVTDPDCRPVGRWSVGW